MAHGCAHGSRRLQAALKAQGICVGSYRVIRLMRQHQLRPAWKRTFIHTTDSQHNLPIAINLLNQQFSRVWVADITYIRTRSGRVADLCARKIVDWAAVSSMPAELVCAVLQVAIVQRHPAAGLVVHSGRDSQTPAQPIGLCLSGMGWR
jgi:transposase InsO family protein